MDREEAILMRAINMPEPERAAYLEQTCKGDALMALRIELALAAQEHPDLVLGSKQNNWAASATPTDSLMPSARSFTGHLIGRYKIIEKLGEGGCGEVYLAEQTKPIRRQVALKVVKPGMDTSQVIARFEAERQALAMMDHPNISKVFDAGSTEEGRPYFVMELVRGIPITAYCEEHKLEIPERLHLFIQICQAIQHAHQKGIIHRDIKPSNILVTVHEGAPAPKIIDFGIAKAVEGRLTDATIYTQLHHFIGTPAYMSPEQATMGGMDIDTRSDIYSLGVVLYELLTGTTPFNTRELLKEGLDAVRRAIREVEPPPPSTRLSTLHGKMRQANTVRPDAHQQFFAKLVRGDLDWIVMKCLEKDRTRRYDMVSGLATDLQRHLNNETVIARPPSAAYRLQKTWRRNKTAFAVGFFIIAIFAGATVISAWQAIRARHAEELATHRASEAEAVSQFLGDVFQSPDPGRDGRSITVAEILNAAVKKLETDLAEQPFRRTSLQAALGKTYYSLGLYGEAIPLQERVVNYYRKVLGTEDAETLLAMASLADSYYNMGRDAEALSLRKEVLTVRQRISGPKNAGTVQALIDYGYSIDVPGAETNILEFREKTLALAREVCGQGSPITIRAMSALSMAYENIHRQPEAEALRVQVLELSRNAFGQEHPSTLGALNNLALSYKRTGLANPVRWNAAIKLQQQVLDIRRNVLGPDHPQTIQAERNLAYSCNESGRYEEGARLWEEVRAYYFKTDGSENKETGWAMYNLATSYFHCGRQEEALKLRQSVLAISQKIYGLENAADVSAMKQLAMSYFFIGQSSDAIALLKKALQINPQDVDASINLGLWEAWLGQSSEFEATCLRLIQQPKDADPILLCERASETCCSAPSSNPVILTNALAMANEALSRESIQGYVPWMQLATGLAAYRNHQFLIAESTLAALEKIGPAVGDDYHDASVIEGFALLLRSSCLFKLNRVEEARTLFTKAEAQMPPLPVDPSRPDIQGKPASFQQLLRWQCYKEIKPLFNQSVASP